MICEYRRCGGLGDHETANRWIARVRVRLNSSVLLTCESCADLLLCIGRTRGWEVTRTPLGTGGGAWSRSSTGSRRPRQHSQAKREKPSPHDRLNEAMAEQRARDLARVEEILASRKQQNRRLKRRRFQRSGA
jgi:hypothetical protein